ncbi:TonB-dependent receptor [Psychroflexus sediminis]|uniref:TonB-dependent Receptor Plug Domain n=1 Tax=Psychroflexus sediminis TaxID=470826 RepID=A0A1G7X5C7_9FLAO|nr:carboxypeptidase regulatory-like domain-containing protein [Psychroflexus sediminis]SDG79409.1 TonB-dependent Receptor Plug Domain [Psychroflexus sediminis]
MKKLLLGLFLIMGVGIYAQGVTTSSMSGKITDSAGEPLPGANVIAVHTPTGTQYGVVTDFDGYYRIANMRVGGPYTLNITYIGFEDIILEGIYLNLGDTERISRQMDEAANALDEVIISASRNNIFDSGQQGSNTNISNREILNLPSATRSLGDFIRKTPEAQVGENGSISLGGQNNRYNTIYIDGAVNNDVFGLAASGTNGGQTGVNPISVDAIESFQVNLSPFDVRQSGFAGGSINAITRSGTNNTEGSAYYYLRNEDLAGKTPTAISEDNREKLSEFTAEIYGARVGGALIKDKLFYFVNYEREEQLTPQPFIFDNYQGESSLQDLANLRQGLIDTYGYDPGIFDNNPEKLESHKLTTRLDWNINDQNTLTFRNSYVDAENTSPRQSNDRNINFINRGVFFPSRTNSSTLEWKTTNGSDMSNNLIIGYTDVLDDRDPLGEPFPSVRIFDGRSGSIWFGSEPFSTANLLEQKLLNITNNFELYRGRHKLTFGVNFEHFDVKNVFFRQNFGDYTFSSLDDFNTYLDGTQGNEVPARFFSRGYSLLGGIGDNSEGAAEFTYSQIGFYAQDDVDISDDFKVSLGVRIDIPYFEDGLANEDFNTRTVQLLEAYGKDLQGARVGKPIESQIHFSPRLGFNWDVSGDNTTQVRGGVGVFTSRIPLVWPGGTYNNNGVTAGTVRDFQLPGDVFFSGDPFDQPVQPGAEPGTGATGGQIDLFTPDFKLPQVAKYNIAVDQKLPVWGLIASGEFLYNDVINAVFYENLNLQGPVGRLNGADNRPFYDRRAVIDDNYDRVILGSNTSEGYSYNATFKLTKPFQNGFAGQIAYTYGDSYNIFEGTSSQNSSQWRGIETVNGKNANPGVQRSAFASGSRIQSNVSYEYEWNDNVKSTVSLFYSGQQGNPFSYVYNSRNDNILNDDSRDNALIYIPRDASEITFAGTPAEQQEQWEAFNGYIESSSYLSERRGQYAERNAEFGPWSHIVDLKFLQDFSLDFNNKKHTFQLSFDIFNFTNLINEDWGRRPFIPGNIGILSVEEGGPNPVFSYNVDDFQSVEDLEVFDDSGILSSRWQMQVGVRYLFN